GSCIVVPTRARTRPTVHDPTGPYSPSPMWVTACARETDRRYESVWVAQPATDGGPLRSSPASRPRARCTGLGYTEHDAEEGARRERRSAGRATPRRPADPALLTP